MISSPTKKSRGPPSFLVLCVFLVAKKFATVFQHPYPPPAKRTPKPQQICAEVQDHQSRLRALHGFQIAPQQLVKVGEVFRDWDPTGR